MSVYAVVDASWVSRYSLYQLSKFIVSGFVIREGIILIKLLKQCLSQIHNTIITRV